MDIVKLSTRERSGRGKSYTRKARASGWIPAVCYGRETESLGIEVSAQEFGRLVRRKQTTHVIDLGLSKDGKPYTVVVKDIQRDIIKPETYEHVDFQHVRMDEKVTVDCPVVVTGQPIGVKEDGGILEHPTHHVTVVCLPGSIPERIEVDVSSLRLGESIHIRDLEVKDAEVANAPDEVVAAVSAPKKEAEVSEEAAQVEGAVEDGAAEAAAEEPQ